MTIESIIFFYKTIVLDFLFYICIFAFVYICATYECLLPQKKAFYPLELKLLMAVGHHVDAGFSTETLCKSNKSLTLLGHLAPIIFNHDFIIFLMMIFAWGIIGFNVVYLSFNHTILFPANP